MGSISASAVVDSWFRSAFRDAGRGIKLVIYIGGGVTVISTVVPSEKRMVIVMLAITFILLSEPAYRGWLKLF